MIADGSTGVGDLVSAQYKSNKSRPRFRMDGQSKIAAPISPAKGTNTLSPFVQLAAR